MARTGGRPASTGSNCDDSEANCGLTAMGSRGAGLVYSAHLRLPVTECQHLFGSGVAGKTVWEDNAPGRAGKTGKPADPGGEHQFIGLLPGHRGGAADFTHR